MDSEIAVINPQFCFPCETHLTIVKKIMPISGTTFMVANDKGDIIFNVKERLLSIHSRHVLLDAAGNTIATLKKKIWSAHGRWQVFKGDSSDPDNVVFSAAQFRSNEIDVLLGNKKENNSWDFKVVADWLERSCIIYDHSTAIAQVQRKHRFRCVMKGKDTLSLTVSPNVDYSFVVALAVALAVLLDRINEDMDD